MHCSFVRVKCDLDRATYWQYAAEENDAAAPSAFGDGFVDKLQQCHLSRYGHDLPALVLAAGVHFLQPGQSAAERWLTGLSEASRWRVIASLLSKGSSYLIQTGTYGPVGAEVTAVPLWDAPLPSPQYAGYVNIPDTDKYIYYQLFVSQQSPLDDRLIVR